MNIDLKFVELTADVLDIDLLNLSLSGIAHPWPLRAPTSILLAELSSFSLRSSFV